MNCYFSKRIFLLFLIFSASAQVVHAQTDTREAPFYDVEKSINDGMPPHIGLNRPASEIMFDRQNHVTDKAVKQLQMRQSGLLEDNKFIVGGRFIGSYIYERTNTPGKFPILSRLPPTHTSGNSDSYGVVNEASINGTLTLPYVTGFAQGEYTEVEYPGQEQKQWRKYWVTLGDLDKFPMYLTYGKKTVAFGDFSSYAPITHNHSSHYFWSQTHRPLVELGYVDNGWVANATLMQNHRGLRVINSPKKNYRWENFAFNLSKEHEIDELNSFKVGAGFIRGTIYDSVLAHHPPAFGLDDRFWASAWNINGRYSYGNFDFMGEFTRTVDDWPATDAHVHALTLQGRYRDYIWELPTTYSLMYSEGVQGDSGDEWHIMRQGVAGLEVKVHPNMALGFEYMINDGFVPLILPRITADDGVVSHTFIAGTKITF